MLSQKNEQCVHLNQLMSATQWAMNPAPKKSLSIKFTTIDIHKIKTHIKELPFLGPKLKGNVNNRKWCFLINNFSCSVTIKM